MISFDCSVFSSLVFVVKFFLNFFKVVVIWFGWVVENKIGVLFVMLWLCCSRFGIYCVGFWRLMLNFVLKCVVRLLFCLRWVFIVGRMWFSVLCVMCW